MPLYLDDFRGGTYTFSNEEVGAYFRLLMAQWDNRGRSVHRTVYRKITEGVETDQIDTKFQRDSDGNFYNERLKMEYDKADAKRRQCLDASQKAAEKRSKKKKTNTRPPAAKAASPFGAPSGTPDDPPDGIMESGSLNKEIRKESGLPFDDSDFAEAWSSYCQAEQDAGRPLTPARRDAAIHLLAGMNRSRALLALRYTVAGGYHSICEPRGEQLMPDRPEPRQPSEADREREAERARFQLVRKMGIKAAADWPAERCLAEYLASAGDNGQAGERA